MIAIIGTVTVVAVPYYKNYKRTACDQAALADLYNVTAVVQMRIRSDILARKCSLILK